MSGNLSGSPLEETAHQLRAGEFGDTATRRPDSAATRGPLADAAVAARDDRAVSGPQRLSSSSAPKRMTAADFDYGRILGAGSFGNVFHVRLHGSTHEYAMKVMQKSFIRKEQKVCALSTVNPMKSHVVSLSKRAQIHFVKMERDVLTKATHPNIIKLAYSFQVRQHAHASQPAGHSLSAELTLPPLTSGRGKPLHYNRALPRWRVAEGNPDVQCGGAAGDKRRAAC